MTVFKSRNESEILPFVSSLQTAIPNAPTDGAEQEGDYVLYKSRSYGSSDYSYLIGTDADTITPDGDGLADISDMPTIRKGDNYVSGAVEIRFAKKGASRTLELIFNSSTPASFCYATGVVSGTILKHSHDLLFNASTAESKSDFYYRTTGGSGVPVASGGTYLTVEKNPDCWASGWDFSGVPIWNSSSNGSQHGGFLLKTNTGNAILVEAEHFASPVGTVFKFRGSNGVIYTMSSIAVNARPSGATDQETQHLQSVPNDLRFHLLDSVRPDAVASYPIAGDWKRIIGATIGDYGSYQVSKYVYTPIACIYLDQARAARWVGSYQSDEAQGLSNDSVIFEGEPVAVGMDTIKVSYYNSESPFLSAPIANGRMRSGITGDSGSGIFFPLSSSTLAAVTVFTSPWSGTNLEEGRCNALIRSAFASAGITSGIPSVTVAPDPTL